MSDPLRFGVPAYGYPGTGVWESLLGLGTGALVIMDPADGPGQRIDPRYCTAVSAAASRGLRVFGYVTADYGRRGFAAMEDEVELYQEWYRPSGIFLDQTPASLSTNTALVELVDSIRGRELSLAINPGQPDIDLHDAALADHVVNFEGPYSTYRRSRFPSWIREFAAAKFWHLIYEVETAQTMRHVAAMARRAHAGIVYVTDATMPNPWERMPVYWREEQALLSSPTRSA